MTSEYVKGAELFVLRAIEDRDLRLWSGANYYLIALSAKDSEGRYCLPVPPQEIGLHLDNSDVVQTAANDYCFRADLLTRNGR